MASKKSATAPRAAPQRRSKGGAQGIKKQLENAEIVERPEPLPLRRPLVPPSSFPMDALGNLGRAAAAIVEMTQCPAAMACQSVLAAATLAAQGVADIVHPRTRQRRPLSNFFVTVAESGERKSGVDAFAVKPIRDRESELRDRHEQHARKYRDERAIYDRLREGILKAPKIDAMEKARQLSALGPPPTAPFDPIILADDPTVEGLHKLLANSEPSLGVFNDEGVQFISGYSMKEENQGYSGGTLSLLWDGKPVKRFRAVDGNLVVVGRRVSVHLMVQPVIVDRLLVNAELRVQGLTSRMLVSVPESRIGFRLQKDPKPGTERALKRYDDRILQLLRQPRKLGGPTKTEPILREMKLSAGAVKKWKGFADECEISMRPDGLFENIKSFANKLPEHVLRISAVLELYDNPEASTVSEATFDRAVTVGRYYADEALRVFDEGSISLEIRRAERLLGWLREKGYAVAHLAPLYQFGPFRNRRMAAEAMDVLEKHGWVVRLPADTKVDGRRRKDAWEVIQT